jgi:hypothetical protein
MGTDLHSLTRSQYHKVMKNKIINSSSDGFLLEESMLVGG